MTDPSTRPASPCLSRPTDTLVPQQRTAVVMQSHPSWDYTTWLNLAFLLSAAALVIRFLSAGGPAMLRSMDAGPGGNNSSFN